jgi:hypothetical protein
MTDGYNQPNEQETKKPQPPDRSDRVSVLIGHLLRWMAVPVTVGLIIFITRLEVLLAPLFRAVLTPQSADYGWTFALAWQALFLVGIILAFNLRAITSDSQNNVTGLFLIVALIITGIVNFGFFLRLSRLGEVFWIEGLWGLAVLNVLVGVIMLRRWDLKQATASSVRRIKRS